MKNRTSQNKAILSIIKEEEPEKVIKRKKLQEMDYKLGVKRKPTKYPILSEIVEPTSAYIIGRLYMQLEEAKETNNFYEIRDACQHLWFAAKSLSSLSCSLNAVHFSIATGNLMRQVADMVENIMGFDPLIDDSIGQWNCFTRV